MARYSSCVGGRTHIEQILLSKGGGKSLIGQKVSVCGWAKTIRQAKKGKLLFVELNDGSCVGNLQVVIDAGVDGFDTVKDSTTGSSMKCMGEIVGSLGSEQLVELQLSTKQHEVRLFGGVEDARTYPLAKKDHTMEYMRSIAHLRPRSNFIGAVARVRSALAVATHKFFRSKGFNYVHTPLITAADCEGAGEMFQVTTLLQTAEKEGKPVPLTVDGKFDYTKDFFLQACIFDSQWATVSGKLLLCFV